MANRDAVLIVGADGLIGRALTLRLAADGQSILTTTRHGGPGSQPLDLATDLSHWTPPRPVSVAYLCAAVASLEQCRKDPLASYAVNVAATMALASSLSRRGTLVVFPSTDLVFDGTVPYQRAEAAACPRTEYGRQKAEVERQLVQLPETCIVRFTKVLGPAAALLCQWQESLRNRQPVCPFSDMVMAPVSLELAVEVLAQIGKRRIEGLMQVSGSRDVTYEEVARHLAARQTADPTLVRPMTVAESGRPVEYVPRYTTLDCSRMMAELQLEPPDVWEAVNQACT